MSGSSRSLSFNRLVLQVGELYDEASLKAVLGEWFRTFQDLPLMIRQSVELVSVQLSTARALPLYGRPTWPYPQSHQSAISSGKSRISMAQQKGTVTLKFNLLALFQLWHPP